MGLFTAGNSEPEAALDERWVPERLPPLPVVALHALHLMADKETSLRDLCEVIGNDSAFSSALLRLANSPLIGFPKEITSVLQASMLLGFRRLKSVAITIGLQVYLEGSYTPLLRSCWRHSLACALIAERSARWSGFDKDSAHTAGIMHDIGRFAMAVSMPQSYARVVKRAAGQPLDILQVERAFCDIDHCEAGLALVNAWHLPDTFIEITSRHHDAGAAAAKGILLLVRPSCRLADFLGFAWSRATPHAVTKRSSPNFPRQPGRTFRPVPRNWRPPSGGKSRCSNRCEGTGCFRARCGELPAAA